MDAKAERLIEALTDPTVSTGEAVGQMGCDASLLRVAKPSSEPATPWVIELMPLPHSTPTAVRVRKLLKIALRELGLKAVCIRNPSPEDQP